MMSEFEKMISGLEYFYDDEEIAAIKHNAIIQCSKYDKISNMDKETKYSFLKQMLGGVGEDIRIERNFNCDNGKNIHIGSHFLANYNFTVLDVVRVTIGDNVMIGPNTLITTVGHPISPKGRRKHLGKASPITIGNDVWIGGNVVILPGVTIGNNVVIGAGAVVTKDIPDNSLAVGIPAKVVKEIENDVE